MSEVTSNLSVVRGALLGAAVGDALGWPQEVNGGLVGGQKARDRAEPEPKFRAWTRQGGHYTRRYEDPVTAGEYSDDTQLMLSVARSCLTGDRWLDHLVGVELPAWPIYQRGGGGAVLTASNSWADGHPPWNRGNTTRHDKVWKRYVGAGANGVAMRIAPHVIVTANYDELIDRVIRDGITTHGHPRALVGALTYAVSLHYALGSRGQLQFGDLRDAAHEGLVPPDRVLHLLPPDWGDNESVKAFADTWRTTNHEMAQLLDAAATSLQRGAMSNATATLEDLGCTNPKINGAGTVTAAAAIYAASRFAARPTQGLLATAFLRKGDTDTLASITATLLGAVHGDTWLDNLATNVQDSRYLAETADRLTHHGHRDTLVTGEEARALRKRWRAEVRRRDPEPAGVFPDGRHYTLDRLETLTNGNRRIRITFEDGQTALVDTTAPTDGYEQQPRPSAAPSRRDTTAEPAQLDAASIGTVSSITAFTPDLNRATAFYARLLGRDLDTKLDETRITDWFVLRRPANSADTTGIGTGTGIGITVTVNDLAAAARRIDADNPAADARYFNTRDPDGRYVRVQRV